MSEYKILLVGDAGVGKSSIIMRFAENIFTDTAMCNVGSDFKDCTLNHQGKEYKLKVWDTAGQERFRAITSSYYQDTHGFVIVYDVTDEVSFNNVKMWFSEIEKYTTGPYQKILIGNKEDLSTRVIAYNTAREWADEYGLVFLETSAKTGTNIQNAFTQLIALLTNKTNDPSEPNPEKQKLRVSSVKKKKDCILS